MTPPLKMKKQINMMKRSIGAYFAARRTSLGQNLQVVRNRTKLSGHQITGFEAGTANLTMGNLLLLMQDLGVGMQLYEQTEPKGEVLGAVRPPEFMSMQDAGHTYVLRWQHPAFLVKVGKAPGDLRLVATYGTTGDAVMASPAWQDLKQHVWPAPTEGKPKRAGKAKA